jgi:hypothetical protein
MAMSRRPMSGAPGRAPGSAPAARRAPALCWRLARSNPMCCEMAWRLDQSAPPAAPSGRRRSKVVRIPARATSVRGRRPVPKVGPAQRRMSGAPGRAPAARRAPALCWRLARSNPMCCDMAWRPGQGASSAALSRPRRSKVARIPARATSVRGRRPVPKVRPAQRRMSGASGRAPGSAPAARRAPALCWRLARSNPMCCDRP